MNTSSKVKILNFFRNIFKLPLLEAVLARHTRGKSPSHFLSKLVPNPYQYRKPSWRTVNYDGIILCLDISDYIGHYYYFGFIDKSHEILFALCKPGFDVLDVGTNIGYTALKLAKLCKPGKVVGFEPDPYNYNLCCQNLALNKCENIEVLNLGLGEVETTLPMEIRTPSNRGGNRIFEKASVGSVGVRVQRLDTIFSDLEFNKIELVKIDVEGYEFRVLKGAEKTLRKFKPVLFIELDDNNLRDQGSSASELIEFLKSLDYTSIINAEDGSNVTASGSFLNCHFDIIVR